jgi:flagellar biosynthesis anti-sigma factor FlgM
MKIENTSMSPLSSPSAESTKRVEKKEFIKDPQSVRAGQDRAEMSENARLLAKARVALGNVEETDTERIAALRKQIENGDYTVQVSELARKLVARMYPK